MTWTAAPGTQVVAGRGRRGMKWGNEMEWGQDGDYPLRESCLSTCSRDITHIRTKDWPLGAEGDVTVPKVVLPH